MSKQWMIKIFKDNITILFNRYLTYKPLFMKEYNIAAIPGDGIGKEVVPEGVKAVSYTHLTLPTSDLV